MNSFQFSVLVSRYFDCLWGDFWNTLLLLMQAPIIAGLIVAVFLPYSSANDNLLFSIVISCIWFGLINSSREIVKEQAVYLRERRFGLDASAYLCSKFIPLLCLGAFQCLILLSVCDYYLHLNGPIVLLAAGLLATNMSATALGLLLSCLAPNADRALTLLPFLIIPQLLLSKLLLPLEEALVVVQTLNYVTISNWGLDFFTLSHPDIAWGDLLFSLTVLLTQTGLFLFCARIALARKS